MFTFYVGIEGWITTVGFSAGAEVGFGLFLRLLTGQGVLGMGDGGGHWVGRGLKYLC
jgi:hypothetical protein